MGGDIDPWLGAVTVMDLHDKHSLRELRELLENVHLDVHGIRRQFIDTIEKSQTALMNRLSLLSAKIDKLTPSGDAVTEADKALMAASLVRMQSVIAKAKALDEMTS